MTISRPIDPFCVELAIAEGAPLADLPIEEGGPVRLSERLTWLRIRSDLSAHATSALGPDDDDHDDEVTCTVPPAFSREGLATMVRTGHDRSRESVGLFVAAIGASELTQLRSAFESITWSKLPRPLGGERGSARVKLRHARGKLVIERGFNVHCGPFIQAIQPIWDLLRDQLRSLAKRPARALAVDVTIDREDERARACVLGLELENRGIGPVVLSDPRLARSDQRPRLRLRVGERVSEHREIPPLEWTELALPPLPEDAPRRLVLEAGQRLQIALPWAAPRPGRYTLRGAWRDLGGPVEAAPGQLPFMPLPRRGPANFGRGPYPIRGFASAELRFEVIA